MQGIINYIADNNKFYYRNITLERRALEIVHKGICTDCKYCAKAHIKFKDAQLPFLQGKKCKKLKLNIALNIRVRTNKRCPINRF